MVTQAARGSAAAGLTLSASVITIAYNPDRRLFTAATLEARVVNTSEINEQFNLDILDLPAEWFTRSKPSARLFPGDNDVFTVTFQPPRAPEARAGEHPFRVRVTPQEQPTAAVEYAAKLVIAPFVDTAFEFVDPTRTGDGEAIFEARLRNGGNVPLTYRLTGLPGEDDAPLAIVISFLIDGKAEASALVTTEPGQVAVGPVQVTAQPRGGASPNSGVAPFRLQAVANADPAWPDVEPPPMEAAGQFTLAPSAPITARVEPLHPELVDLLAEETTCRVIVTNPSRQPVGVRLAARAASADLDAVLEPAQLVLPAKGEQAAVLTIRRSSLATPVTTPQRQLIQLMVQPDDSPAAPAASGVPITAPAPIEVDIQPAGVQIELREEAGPDGPGRFTVLVRNRGNRPAPVALAIRDLESPAMAAFGAPTAQGRPRGEAAPTYALTVPPRDEIAVPLTINLPPLPVGSQPRRVDFQVVGAINGRSLHGLSAAGEFEHTVSAPPEPVVVKERPAERPQVDEGEPLPAPRPPLDEVEPRPSPRPEVKKPERPRSGRPAGLLMGLIALMLCAGLAWAWFTLVDEAKVAPPPTATAVVRPTQPPAKPTATPPVAPKPKPAIADIDPDPFVLQPLVKINRPLVIQGSGFAAGASVQLSRPGQPTRTIGPARVQVTPTRLTVALDDDDLTPGAYTVVVVNPGDGDTRSNERSLRVVRQ